MGRQLMWLILAYGLSSTANAMLMVVWTEVYVMAAGGDSAMAATLQAHVTSARALVQLALLPLLGSAADVVGRRPILFLSYFACGLEFLLLATVGISMRIVWSTRLPESHTKRTRTATACPSVIDSCRH